MVNRVPQLDQCVNIEEEISLHLYFQMAFHFKSKISVLDTQTTAMRQRV